MTVEGERRFAAAQDTVWAVLNDPERLARAMPGVESFEVHDDAHWTAHVKIPLGLGALRMTVAMEKTDVQPPDYARLAAKGQGVGALMHMETSFHLSPTEDGTRMRWHADVRILGAVGSLGHRVLEPIVNQQIEHVLGALDAEVTAASV